MTQTTKKRLGRLLSLLVVIPVYIALGIIALGLMAAFLNGPHH